MINGNNMYSDQYRKTEICSPKSSPRDGRTSSTTRQDSSGTLKINISLGKIPAIVQHGSFYLLKPTPAEGESELTGATNLMAHYGLQHSYSKFSGKKVKEQLSSFLPNLPGVVDGPGVDNSTLRSIIEKPPIGGKELLPLTNVQLAGFRLHPGPLPEQYRHTNNNPVRKNKKNKKHRHKDSTVPIPATQTDLVAESHEKKHKKQKRHEDDKSERKKRKKEKKRKKQRHSPEPPATNVGNNGIIGSNGSSVGF